MERVGSSGEAFTYWEDMYEKQKKEVPENEYEKQLLILLGEGKSITGSLLVLQRMFGVPVAEGFVIFENLRERCNIWEVRNLL